MLYTDDMHVYKSFDLDDFLSYILCVEKCIRSTGKFCPFLLQQVSTRKHMFKNPFLGLSDVIQRKAEQYAWYQIG